MGKQAKLKQQRRQQQANPVAQSPETDEQFVKQLQRQGHRLDSSDRSPTLPENRPEPQV